MANFDELKPEKNPYAQDGATGDLLWGSGRLLAFGTVVILLFTSLSLLYVKWQQTEFTTNKLEMSGGEHLGSAERMVLQGYLALYADDLNRPAGDLVEDTEFVISPGENANQIVINLITSGVLTPDKEGLFLNYLSYYDLDSKLAAGEFGISAKQTIPELAAKLTNPIAEAITLNFLPGLRIEEYANYLAVTRPADISAEEFLAYATRKLPFDLSPYPALRGLSDEDSLEGFLYPDSYRVSQDATAEEMIGAMLSNFEQRLTPLMRDRISAQDLTIRELVSVASIVQREAVNRDERALIASVFLNRLEDGNITLGADPTIQYALGASPDGNWWKSPLSLTDLKVDSPYNTYVNMGLPPSPIANPSIDTLNAVTRPADSDYLYFVADCDEERPNTHLFAVTYDEHLANIDKCLE